MHLKTLVIAIVAILTSLSCKNEVSNSASATGKAQETEKIFKAGDTITLNSMQENTRESLAYLKTLVGKKPSDVQLFAKAEMKKRISKIMEGDYADFESSWLIDTPLQEDNEIIYTYACKTKDCLSHRYILIFDTMINAINIYKLEGRDMRSYVEDKTVLGMPHKAQKWFDEIVESHMKIK